VIEPRSIFFSNTLLEAGSAFSAAVAKLPAAGTDFVAASPVVWRRQGSLFTVAGRRASNFCNPSAESG